MEELDYIDEIIVDYMEGNFDLEDLEQPELDLVLERLQEITTSKILEGFEEACAGRIVYVEAEPKYH